MGLRNQVIASQSYRDLDEVVFAEGQTVSRDLPLDTAIKRMLIRGEGYFRCDYASGSPVVDEAGISGRLINRLEVSLNGDTIKSLDPLFMQKQQLLLLGTYSERAIATSASTFSSTTRIASTEMNASGAPFTLPATTNFVLFNESFTIYFEHPHLYNQGKMQTILYTKGARTGFISFSFSTLSNIQRAETSPVALTFPEFSIKFKVTLVENRAIVEDSKNPFLYFRESMYRPQFSGQVSDFPIDLQTGGLLTGLHILARDGSANKLLSDKLIQRIKLIGDTTKVISDVKFLQLQNENRSNYGINSARASNKTQMQGYCYLPLVFDGLLSTALETSNFNTLQLKLDTAPASGIDSESYTNPAQVSILLQEVVAKSFRA